MANMKDVNIDEVIGRVVRRLLNNSQCYQNETYACFHDNNHGDYVNLCVPLDIDIECAKGRFYKYRSNTCVKFVNFISTSSRGLFKHIQYVMNIIKQNSYAMLHTCTYQNTRSLDEDLLLKAYNNSHPLSDLIDIS